MREIELDDWIEREEKSSRLQSDDRANFPAPHIFLEYRRNSGELEIHAQSKCFVEPFRGYELGSQLDPTVAIRAVFQHRALQGPADLPEIGDAVGRLKRRVRLMRERQLWRVRRG